MIVNKHVAMKKLFICLVLALFLCTEPCSCQSVGSVCRFRTSGTFPHPNAELCGLFIQCWMFQSIVRECPSGTIFSSGANQCVPGDRDTCTVGAPASTTPAATSTVNLNICEGINVGSIAIPGDCTRFILCLLGEGELISCGNNEVFDQTLGRCVSGNPLTCEVFTTTTLATTTTLSTTTTSTSSTLPITVSSSTASTSSSPPIGNVCTGNNLRYVANPFRCYRYFYCLFGVPVPGECAGSSTIFVEAQQSCVPGDRATCTPFIN